MGLKQKANIVVCMSLFSASALHLGGPESTLVGGDAPDEELRVAKKLVGSDASDNELRVAKMKIEAKLKEIQDAVARNKQAEDKARLDELRDKTKTGELTPEEEVELDRLEDLESTEREYEEYEAADEITSTLTPEAVEDITSDLTPETVEEITSTLTPDSISEDEVAGSLLGGASAEVNSEALPRPPRKPNAPGCYYWMPKGCPMQEMKSGTLNKITASTYDKKKWRHDSIGERKLNANKDQEMCVVRRKRNFDNWCNHTQTRMAFVPVRAPKVAATDSRPGVAGMFSPVSRPWTNRIEAPPAPSKPGCYYWMPHGCPRQEDEQNTHLIDFKNDGWRHDTIGEKTQKAMEYREVCDTKRKLEFDEFCGHTETRMIFVAGSAPLRPTEGGCFVWQPTGCRNNAYVGPNERLGRHPHPHWRQLSVDVGLKDAECLNRKAEYDEACDVADTQMVYVPVEPQRPAEPGCYIWQPYGCPLQHSTTASVDWYKDQVGEDSKAACWEREHILEERCGDEARSFFVERPDVIAARREASRNARDERKRARRLRQRQEEANNIEQEFEEFEELRTKEAKDIAQEFEEFEGQAQEAVPATEGERTAPAGSREPAD